MMKVTYNDYGLNAKLANYSANMDTKIRLGLRDASIVLERQIVKNLSGLSHTRQPGNGNPFVGAVSGDLKRAIGYTIKPHEATIGVEKVIPYAAIHEFGGTIPVSSRMRWFLGLKKGIWLKKSTTIIRIPKRAYIAPAFKAKREAMVAALQNQLMKGLTR
jgi:phage gpG-like protein